jgi:hypothetical protein
MSHLVIEAAGAERIAKRREQKKRQRRGQISQLFF